MKTKIFLSSSPYYIDAGNVQYNMQYNQTANMFSNIIISYIPVYLDSCFNNKNELQDVTHIRNSSHASYAHSLST